MQLYSLPHRHRLKEYHLAHERMCGDLYVAYKLAGMDYWKAPAEPDAYGLKPDRIMVHRGKLVFWEADRNTEGYRKIIRGKLDRYVQISEDNPQKRFHVIFTTVDYRQSAKSRCQALLDIFCEYSRGDQFLTTTQEWAIVYAEYSPFLSPISPMGVSIEGAI